MVREAYVPHADNAALIWGQGCSTRRGCARLSSSFYSFLWPLHWWTKMSHKYGLIKEAGHGRVLTDVSQAVLLSPHWGAQQTHHTSNVFKPWSVIPLSFLSPGPRLLPFIIPLSAVSPSLIFHSLFQFLSALIFSLYPLPASITSHYLTVLVLFFFCFSFPDLSYFKRLVCLASVAERCHQEASHCLERCFLCYVHTVGVVHLWRVKAEEEVGIELNKFLRFFHTEKVNFRG